ncbi:hypothetical protein B0T21DRAFT_354539 [Apiosordaria backusii]|uniref:Uncharacterized protein n=1 Tax=Apiosordaria backusii TaxID=314023 RepID=A0AA40EXV0_9PEZI|nr:hypothetical protein B0T21DRAFT_354539 [Apiosordaria backusii]
MASYTPEMVILAAFFATPTSSEDCWAAVASRVWIIACTSLSRRRLGLKPPEVEGALRRDMMVCSFLGFGGAPSLGVCCSFLVF